MNTASIARLKDMLKRMSPGRNRSFLYSFGGKDADLEPQGDWGIEDVQATQSGLLASIRGYKTFCDPVGQFELDPATYMVECERAHEILMYAISGAWAEKIVFADVDKMSKISDTDEDAWYFKSTFQIRMRWRKKEGRISYTETAEQLIKLVERKRKPVVTAWTCADTSLNEQYDRLDNQIKKIAEK